MNLFHFKNLRIHTDWAYQKINSCSFPVNKITFLYYCKWHLHISQKIWSYGFKLQICACLPIVDKVTPCITTYEMFILCFQGTLVPGRFLCNAWFIIWYALKQSANTAWIHDRRTTVCCHECMSWVNNACVNRFFLVWSLISGKFLWWKCQVRIITSSFWLHQIIQTTALTSAFYLELDGSRTYEE